MRTSDIFLAAPHGASQRDAPGASRGILLVNTGTPEAPTPEAIRSYLRRFLSNRRIINLPSALWQPVLHCVILPLRPLKTVDLYRHVWTAEGAPYTLYSRSVERQLKRRIADDVAARAGVAAEPPLVRMAHHYSEPSIFTTLKLFCEHGISELTVLPLYPQQAFATTESVRDELKGLLTKLGYHPRQTFIDNYHDHPLYLQALANSITATLPPSIDPATTRLIFSYHSTPLKDRRHGDRYYAQTQNTARLVATAANLPEDSWQVAYQSRFSDGQKWIGPFLLKTLDELLACGTRNFYVIAPGFAVDNIETLHEIKYVAANHLCQRASASGLTADDVSLTYIPALNDSDAQIELLSVLVDGRT